MKKTPEQIRKKRELKKKQLHFLVEKKEKQKLQAIDDTVLEYKIKLIAKIQRKNLAYIKKKELEYDRKMNNELRQLAGKPQREYNQKKPTKNQKLQFALAIAQENSKLRDTNENGEGFCVSCNQKKSWSELAGGHRYSRMYQSICFYKANINAQCHSCNWATGPKGNTLEAERVNAEYDKNIIKKRGEDDLLELQLMKQKELSNPSKYKLTEPFIDEIIPELIAENERLWKTKSFYKPKKAWRRLYTKMTEK
ncbi:MAG: hypothetical protein DLD55_01455 [candidate division SR1 bacterium]|nr:MAG: hypothetical protein DLD55_01455 [candidate division SR1 bacterium]